VKEQESKEIDELLAAMKPKLAMLEKRKNDVLSASGDERSQKTRAFLEYIKDDFVSCESLKLKLAVCFLAIIGELQNAIFFLFNM
jgi:hypothetical protein